jgi:MbtH protein
MTWHPLEGSDMTNPFDDDSGQYLALVNDEGQYSLWPALIEPPAGWTVTAAARSRSECLAYIEANWTDLRPASLIAAMGEEHE